VNEPAIEQPENESPPIDFPEPPEGSGIRLKVDGYSHFRITCPWQDEIDNIIDRISKSFWWGILALCLMMFCIKSIWPEHPVWVARFVLFSAIGCAFYYCFRPSTRTVSRDEIYFSSSEFRLVERSWCRRILSQSTFHFSSHVRIEHSENSSSFCFNDKGTEFRKNFSLSHADANWLAEVFRIFLQQTFPDERRDFVITKKKPILSITPLDDIEMYNQFHRNAPRSMLTPTSIELPEPQSPPKFNPNDQLNVLEELESRQWDNQLFNESAEIFRRFDSDKAVGLFLVFLFPISYVVVFVFIANAPSIIYLIMILAGTVLWSIAMCVYFTNFATSQWGKHYFTLEKDQILFNSTFPQWLIGQPFPLPLTENHKLFYHPMKEKFSLVDSESNELLTTIDCRQTSSLRNDFIWLHNALSDKSDWLRNKD